MALGDSITAAPGCWRPLLADSLDTAAQTPMRFVGSQDSVSGCAVGEVGAHEGHSGIRAMDVAAQGLVTGWMRRSEPDIVLMHLGTNDIRAGQETADILAAFSTMVRQMRESHPEVRIVVAQIIPMSPGACEGCAEGVAALNIALPGWAAHHSEADAPILVADHWTGFDAERDTRDGVHPDTTGQVKIAQSWLPPLTALLATRGSTEKRP
jgi:lysophospholipase L1-like esterase